MVLFIFFISALCFAIFEGSRVQIVKDGLYLWVDPAVDISMPLPLLRPRTEGSVRPPLRVGTPVALRMPNACTVRDHYIAIGDEGKPSAGQPRIQLFFNIDPEGGIILMRIITLAFNRSAIPFTLMILADPNSYHRYDGAILELEAIYFASARSLLEASYSEILSHLRNPIPLFTKQLSVGIGLQRL